MREENAGYVGACAVTEKLQTIETGYDACGVRLPEAGCI